MSEMRGRVTVIVALALIAVGFGALLGRMPPAPTEPVDGPKPHEPAASESTVAVHVAGMVVYPGVVDVPAGSIVADAIEAAGGLRAGARVEEINLAAPVAPGDQIVVPGPTEEGDAPDVPGDGLISLSQASATELEGLPGVGPVLAERIVSHREASGRFEVVEDLLQVPGIGEAKLDAPRELVTP
jgi:competence protein ComEA